MSRPTRNMIDWAVPVESSRSAARGPGDAAMVTSTRIRDPARQILVAQLGARMHYAVPRIFAEAGTLGQLCTDICAVKGWPRAIRWLPKELRPRSLNRLAGRVPHGIARDRITAFTAFGLDFARRQARARSPSEVLAAHLWAGRTFSTRVRDQCLTRTVSELYCFNSAGLELMRAASERGVRTILEQTIAPRDIGTRLLRDEHDAFPGWERPLPETEQSEALARREHDEWSVADLIVCGSAFVRDGIAARGGPVDRCVIVPYGVDGAFAVPNRAIQGRHLNVLTVGEVGLRKGAPYALAAAKRAGGDVTLRMVGGTSLSPQALAEVAAHAELTGPVPRSQIRPHFRWADVFLLPSLYEGSATVIYEALSAGLPVICTPNAGSIVRDGIDGYIVPIRDVDAIVDRLGRLADPILRAQMSANARERAVDGNLAAYRERLLDATSSLRNPA